MAKTIWAEKDEWVRKRMTQNEIKTAVCMMAAFSLNVLSILAVVPFNSKLAIDVVMWGIIFTFPLGAVSAGWVLWAGVPYPRRGEK